MYCQVPARVGLRQSRRARCRARAAGRKARCAAVPVCGACVRACVRVVLLLLLLLLLLLHKCTLFLRDGVYDPRARMPRVRGVVPGVRACVRYSVV